MGFNGISLTAESQGTHIKIKVLKPEGIDAFKAHINSADNHYRSQTPLAHSGSQCVYKGNLGPGHVPSIWAASRDCRLEAGTRAGMEVGVPTCLKENQEERLACASPPSCVEDVGAAAAFSSPSVD